MLKQQNKALKQHIAEQFSASAACYDEKAHIQGEIGKAAVALWKEHKVEMLLDIGCGTGSLTATLSQHAQQVIGFDLSLGMLAFSRQRNAKLAENHEGSFHWLAGDADDLPFANNVADGIFSSMALQWSENIPACFNEIYRVARPGAKVLLGIMSQGSIAELQQSFAVIDDEPHTNQFYSQQYLFESAQNAGFKGKASTQIFQSWHESVLSVMHSIKDIGAGVVNHRTGVTPLTKSRLKRLQQQYQQQFSQEKGLPLSYHVTFLELTK